MTSNKKRTSSFLFLEFLDPEINGLLTRLRSEFGYDDTDTEIHLTVRGPYDGPISSEEIAKHERILQDDQVFLHGAGIFENPKESIVYIKVASPNLKNIWWKRDYPREKFGYNPHISLYKGKDRELARLIYGFIEKERLELICRKFRLTPYSSKQRELFPFEQIPKENQFLELANRRLVRPDILQRAANLVRDYKRTHSGQLH